MVVDGEKQICTCGERPYADWTIIGPEVMRWLQNRDRFDRSIQPLREGEVP